MLTGKHLMVLRNAPNSLYYWLKVEFLFHSNKIEGSTFTTEQLSLLMDKGIVLGEHKLNDVVETANSLELFEYMMDSLGTAIDQDLILRFHSILKKNTKDEEAGLVGTWKKYSNRISGSAVKLASPGEVRERIKDLLYRWEISGKSFEDIVRFHVEFEQVHPFQDGNGRVGRYLMIKQCLENNVSPIVVDSEHATEYRRALEKAQLSGDLSDCLRVMSECQARFESKDIVVETLSQLENRDS